MVGRILLGLCAAAFWSQAARAEQPAFDLAANVDLVSDYRFRGVSQTGLDPALQPSLTVSHKSGLYLNAWASNISRTDGGAHTEVDFGAGYAWESGDTSVDLAATYYTYPGDGELNYAELSAAVAHAFGSFEPHLALSYVPPQSATRNDLGRKKDSVYLAAGADFTVPGTPVTLSANLGYERGFFDYDDSGGKLDWQLGASVQLEHVGFEILYVDTSETVRDRGGNIAGAGVVAQISVGF